MKFQVWNPMQESEEQGLRIMAKTHESAVELDVDRSFKEGIRLWGKRFLVRALAGYDRDVYQVDVEVEWIPKCKGVNKALLEPRP